jgi:serine/threonine-protein kinase SRPK3
MTNASTPLPRNNLVEPLDQYRPGGYHPVHIGDTFDHGRYTVHNKLGWGGTSTVWLATDAEFNDICVALSIFRSDCSTFTDEFQRLARVQLHLQNSGEEHPGKASILLPYRYFDTRSPNGDHFCDVLKFEGQTICRATKRNEGWDARPLDIARASRTVVELIDAVSYLHGMGVCHGGRSQIALCLLRGQDEVTNTRRFGMGRYSPW